MHLRACERVHYTQSTMMIQHPTSNKKKGRKRKVEEKTEPLIITKSFPKRRKKNIDKDNDDEAKSDNNHENSVVKTIDNYMLLHAALNDPTRVMNEGVGLWMIEKLFQEYKLDMPCKESDIHQQWNSIIGSMQQHDDHHIKDVLTIIFASRSPEAQCVALIAAGWTFIPPRDEDYQKSHRQRKNKVASATIYQSGLWKYDGNVLTLNEAWDEYAAEIEKDVNKEYENIKIKLQEIAKDIVIPQKKKTKKSKPPPETESKTQRTPAFPVEKKSVEKFKDTERLKVFSSKERPKPLKEVTKKLLTVHELLAHNLTAYKRRLSYVKKGDPRPTLYCTWCGPKLPEGEELKEETICDACMILFDKGWRYECESYISTGKVKFSTKYISTEGKVMRNAKTFLSSTSNLIVKALSTVSEDNKSDSVNKTEYKNNNKSNYIEIEEDSDEDDNDHNSTLHEIRQKQLPTYDEMIMTEWGLCGVLKQDELCLLNLCYGTDSTIAYLILQPLLTNLSSSFPSQITNETPFERLHTHEITNNKVWQSKYYGVVKVDNNKNNYAVEFPMLIVKDHNTKSFTLPSCYTSRGKKTILTSGIENEYLAGQFYAFVIRVLYGNEGMKAAKESCVL